MGLGEIIDRTLITLLNESDVACVHADGVTDMQFTPNRSVLSVDEELRCSARGNPTPEVALGPAAVVKKAKSGDGWSSLVVQADWVGRTMTVECSAANSVDGREFSESHSVTFNVTGQRRLAPLRFVYYSQWLKLGGKGAQPPPLLRFEPPCNSMSP